MRIPLKWSGGVNQLEDPQEIRDDQVVETKNAYPSQEGLLDKREAVRAIGGFTTGAPASNQIQPVTLWVPDPILGVDFILHSYAGLSVGQTLHAVRISHNDTVVPDVDEYTVTTEPLAGPASIVNYKGRTVVVIPGKEGFIQLTRDDDGSLDWVTASFGWAAGKTGVVAGQVQTLNVYPRVVGTFRGRLVFANFGLGMENWIVFADRDIQTGWTNLTDAPPWAIVGGDVLANNGRHLEISAIQGQAIIGLKEISLQAVGSPLRTALLIQTSSTAILATGEPAQTTDTDFSTPAGYIQDFVANKVNYQVGLAGPNALCETPYGLCWASHDDVWLMMNNTPIKVGTLIRPALRDTPIALRAYWSMCYANGFVFLAICTSASGSETDLRVQHWRLDLRRGPPEDPSQARWYGPHDYQSIPDFAGGGVSTCGMAASIVSKRGVGDKDIVYGAVRVVNSIQVGYATRVIFISYNDTNGGDDWPFPDVSSGRVWSADDNASGNVIQIGDITRPTILKANGRLYVATVAGIPGVTEPVWPIASGAQVVDGGVTWSEILYTGSWNRLPSFFNGALGSDFQMDVIFKDLNFAQAARDKILRRADIIAYFSNRSLASIRATINQGGLARILGPTPIGAEGPAGNDLGLAILDTAAIAQEYEARALRPGATTGYAASDPLTSWTTSDTGLAGLGGVIRGRSIQPRFMDDDGLVIDGTNDYISWCSYSPTKPSIISQVLTAQLTQGRYANVDALLTEIVAKMNMAQGTTLTGFTIAANPWSYDSAFVNNYPYMTTLLFTFTARLGSHADCAVALVFGTSLTSTLLTTTCYPVRTRRLLAMLGYDTTSRYRDATGLTYLFGDASQVQLAVEQESPVLASPTRICGVQSIPYTRSPFVSLSDIELDYYVKPGLPFSKVSR